MEKNWGIIGHQKIVDFLQKSISARRLAHTYLFYGQSSLGKTTLAEKFAQILLKTPEALVTELFKIELLTDKKNISIEQIREWRQKLVMKSFNQGYKVGIIYEAEKLNIESANALLKTIEEPTPLTIIVLITSAWDKILPTIISRSQLIRFSLVSREEIINKLSEINYSINDIERIYNLVGGYPGKIINYLNNPEALAEYKKLDELVAKMITSRVAEKFLIIEQLLAKVKEFNSKIVISLEFLKQFKILFRNLLLNNWQLTKWQQGFSQKIDKQYSLRELINMEEALETATEQLLSNVQPRLVLENLFINI